jgi:hypothetical protein
MLDEPTKQKATHHLTSMKIDEVSFVSRGANGRNKWLLAKSAEGEPVASEPSAPEAPQASEPEIAAETPVAPAAETPPALATTEMPAPVSAPEPAPVPAPAEPLTPVEPAPPPESPPAPPAPDPDVEKTHAAAVALHRKVWNLIHRTVDGILAGMDSPASASAEAPAVSESVELAAKQTSAVPPFEVKLPETMLRALEQIPALVAEVQTQKAALAKLTGQRMGPTALSVEGVGEMPSATFDPWAGVHDLADEVARKRQQSRR